MTYNEIITKQELYQYSNDHLELLKECYELKLNAEYIKNQLFIKENAQLFNELEFIFTEGYITESAEDYELEVIIEKTDSKIDKVKNTIMSGIRFIVEKFISLLIKIGVNIDKHKLDIKDVFKRFKELDSKNPIDLSEFVKHSRKILSDKNNYFKPATKQPGAESLTDKLVTINGINRDKAEELAIILAVTLNESAFADVAFTGNPSTIGALPANVLVSVMKDIFRSDSSNKFDIAVMKSAKIKLEESWKRVSVSGFEIVANSSKLNKIVKELKSIQEKLSNLVDSKSYKIDIDGNKVINNSEGVDEFRKIYLSINKSIALSMRVYASYDGYRTSCIKYLQKMFNKHFDENS